MTAGKPELSIEEAGRVALSKPHPKVTKELIEGKISGVEYFTSGVLTVAVITMQNGFKVVGKSAPASPDNFDRKVGETYAFNDAFQQLWALEGYLLRQQLFDAEPLAG